MRSPCFLAARLMFSRGALGLFVSVLPVIPAQFIISGSAAAHAWYPSDCCDDRDCGRVESIIQLPDQSLVVTISGLHIAIPANFPTRASPDSDTHVCFYFDNDTNTYRPRCYFVPPNS
jgi:hypothetical protein